MAIRNISALSFDGTQSCRLTTNSLLPIRSMPRSICFWIKPKSLSLNQVVFSYGDTQSLKELSIHINGVAVGHEGKIMLSYYDNAFITQDVVLEVGKWTHVAITLDCRYDLSNLIHKVYVNGVVKPRTTVSGYSSNGIANTTNTVAFIGKRIDNTSFLNADLDEFSIWNTQLSERYIKDNILNKKLKGNEQDLLHYYSFDESRGTIHFDSTSNNNHAYSTKESFTTDTIDLTYDKNDQDLHVIGIRIPLDSGNYKDTVFADGRLELKTVGYDVSGMPSYASTGFYETYPIDLHDKINSFKRVVFDAEINGSFKIFTSTSLDRVTWTPSVEVGVNNEILSPLGKYVIVKVEIYSKIEKKKFELENYKNTISTNKYIDFSDNGMKLKYTYRDMMNVKESGEGSVILSSVIEKSYIKRIDKIRV